MKPNLNILRIEIISLLLAMILGNCQPSTQNTKFDHQTEVNSNEDCDPCFDRVFSTTQGPNFDSMVNCGRKEIRCGIDRSGTLLLVIGYTGLGQLDSSDKYANQLVNMSINDPYDSFFYYSAMAHQAINGSIRMQCNDSILRHFKQVWMHHKDLRSHIFTYYHSLLCNCGKYNDAIRICNLGIQYFSDDLSAEKLAYTYEILALANTELGASQDIICKYLDSSIQIAPTQRTLQRRQETCK